MQIRFALLLSLFTAAFSIHGITQENGFNGGVKLGIAGTQVSGDGFRGFNKAGIVGGAFVSRQFNDHWGGVMEMIYIRKGSFDPPDPENGKFDQYRIDLQYIELPLMATFELSKFHWELGPSFGYMFSHKQEDEFGPVREEDLKRLIEMRNWELALNVGMNFHFSEKFYLNVRYSRSIYPIANRPQWITGYVGLFGGSYNTALHFTFGYHIFGRSHNFESKDRQKSF